MGTREIFRENLRFFRKQRGLTQERLSELIGYGGTYITEIESRHKFPKPETIDAIASALKIEPFQLFQSESDESTKEKVATISELLYQKISSELRENIVREVTNVFYS